MKCINNMHVCCLLGYMYMYTFRQLSRLLSIPIIPSAPSRDKQTDEWKKNKRAIELNNGRAAQMGIAGIMVHELMGNLGDILPATP